MAEKAGDTETRDLAERLLQQEREAAERIYGAFDRAVDASLEAVGVPMTTAFASPARQLGAQPRRSPLAGGAFATPSGKPTHRHPGAKAPDAKPAPKPSSGAECPRSLRCNFVPAAYAQNSPTRATTATTTSRTGPRTGSRSATS